MATSIAELVAKFPDVQLVGGRAILNFNNKNVDLGEILSGDSVSLTEKGKELVDEFEVVVEAAPEVVEPEVTKKDKKA
jgi:hypothetical protein